MNRVVEQDWRVESICLTSEARKVGTNAAYRFHVRGRHASGESFSWAVPDVKCARYDLSGATITPEVLTILNDPRY